MFSEKILKMSRVILFYVLSLGKNAPKNFSKLKCVYLQCHVMSRTDSGVMYTGNHICDGACCQLVLPLDLYPRVNCFVVDYHRCTLRVDLS